MFDCRTKFFLYALYRERKALTFFCFLAEVSTEFVTQYASSDWLQCIITIFSFQCVSKVYDSNNVVKIGNTRIKEAEVEVHPSKGHEGLMESRNRPGTLCTGGWLSPRDCLDGWGKSRPPPGFDPRTAQPAASRRTDCFIQAHTVE